MKPNQYSLTHQIHILCCVLIIMCLFNQHILHQVNWLLEMNILSIDYICVCRMNPLRCLSITFLLWCSVQSVDRSNFKTCDQSSFCKYVPAAIDSSSYHTILLPVICKLSIHVVSNLIYVLNP